MVEYGEQLIRRLLMVDGDVPEDEASAGAEALTARFPSAATWAGIASADVGALEGIDEYCGDQFWSMGIEGLCEAGLLDEETWDSTMGYRSEACDGLKSMRRRLRAAAGCQHRGSTGTGSNGQSHGRGRGSAGPDSEAAGGSQHQGS